MRHFKQLIACCMALALLCYGCSAGDPVLSEPKAVTALPLAEQGTTVTEGLIDVPTDAWYAEAAAWCREHNILTGTTFDANTAMTRATVADALYRAEGSPSVQESALFSDVPAGSPYAAAASWASANGVMFGYGGGRFGGEDPVTRKQMAAIPWRYAGSPAASSGENFADEANIADFAKTAIDWARANNILNGTGGNRFDPKGTLTRAQTAVILYRYLTNGKEGGDTDPVVYMTTDISSDGLMAIYAALNWTPGDHVAVKLSTGEPGSNYLRTDLIGDLVKSLDDPTIVECNTAYGGSRSNTAMHYQVAEDCYRKIATTLNTENVPTPTTFYYIRQGKPNIRKDGDFWAAPTVKAIVRNEVYLGHMVQNKTGNLSYKVHKQIAKPESEWIRVENIHEPLISRETWDMVRELDARKAKFRSSKTGETALFTGVLFCMDCKSPYAVL